jgi:hypothetical protein
MGFFGSKKAPTMSDELAEACGAKPCSHTRYGRHGSQEGKYIVWRCAMCQEVMSREYDPPFN